MTKLETVIGKLKEVMALAAFIDLRRRYASMEQWREQGPELKARQQELWIEAKEFICEHRDELDKLAKSYEHNDLDNYTQAVLVIEQEAEKMIEALMTGDSDES